jgi:steroid delta-isomerase-like uncharacterized protein
MSIESNKALVRRMIEELHNKGNIAAAKDIIADTFTARGALGVMKLSREEYVQFVAGRRAAIPNLHITIDELVAEGDRVVARGHDEGTPIAEYLGLPPTGKSFNVTWIDIYWIENGRIAGMDYEMSMETLRAQLGA